MSAEVPSSAPALPAFSGVYVFGDSLVDPGNDLEAAEFLGRFPFVSVPNGAPTADKGYFEGRFTNGYNFADLISNKLLGEATDTTFPYGVTDALVGVPTPFLDRPEGNNLNFAYGGARAIQGPDPAPALGGQVEVYDDFTPDPNALYIVSIGANDVLSLVPTGGTPVVGAEAEARLVAIASEISQQVAHLFGRGARHVAVVDVPNVGVTPSYAGAQDEATRRSLLGQYVDRVDDLISANLAALPLPAGTTVLDYDFAHYTNAVVANPALYGFTNVTQALTSQPGPPDPARGGFLFFDKLHPTAQTHAQVASEILDGLQNPGGPLNWTAAPAIGSRAAGSIASHGVDHFAAALTGGQTYVVDLLGVSSGLGTLADPRLRVLDGSRAVVAEDDDGGRGLDSHLQFVAPATGDFTIEVLGVGVSGGSYRLQAGGPGGSNLLLAGQLRGSDIGVLGGAANDTIVALAGDNRLRGGDGADSILGGTGFDRINGNTGDDSIVGRSLTGDWLLGGQGNDSISAAQSSGHNIVNGNLGADSVTGGSGGDTLRGGQASDVITGGSGADWLSGDLGDDTLSGGGGADIFHAGPGADRILDFNLGQGDRVLLDPGAAYALSQVGADAVVTVAGGQLTLVGVQAASLTGGWIFGA